MGPALERALPTKCTTDESKLLYLITHRDLASTIKGVPLTVPLANDGSISLSASGALELKAGHGQPPIRLNNAHDDLARMFEVSDARMPERPSAFVAASELSLDQLLDQVVHTFYRGVTAFDGGALAEDTRGSNTFTFATMQQVLVSPDPSQVGLECLATADFHLYKSMGLIPPELSREEVEHRYTSIHGDSKPGTPRLSRDFDKSLRGIPGGKPFSPREVVAFANALRADDWAKLTGAARGSYVLKPLPTIGAVANHFARGGAAVHAGWANGGHHFVLSMVTVKDGVVRVNEDDSLRLAPKRRDRENWPNPKPYDPQEHANFWSIAR